MYIFIQYLLVWFESSVENYTKLFPTEGRVLILTGRNLGWSVNDLDMSIPNSEFSFFTPQGVGKNAQITKSFQIGKYLIPF
ncbi:hypothetical protein DDB_G0274531 [Dictyostelium discoideum AX4]|uniref:hypothetical protein n=1 Tax=Dictyostelium discoideum AX4 TaxID=352472 RepID=UPI0000006EE8|nr:hypothetical protein DDB_G0274531 [Dictyostelium discoideum AX4]EAL70158.1 hypothetical protein DDB_G0274531 [Dictyostelium discoideum AX4]|eukprot:XP_644074.1 hypothetical protein DDB_G0274531 [Dictyostelium discoideum AX4]